MDDELLAWFRDEVVTPIVASVLTPNELDAIEVRIGPRPPLSPVQLRLEAQYGLAPPGDEWEGPRVWVDVTAGQGTEHYRNTILSARELGDVGVVRDRAAQLASDLEDWVCETRFGWGQQREATVPVIVRPR